MVYPDFSAGVKEVDLGPENSFTEFPTTVALDGGDFLPGAGQGRRPAAAFFPVSP